MYLLFFIVSLVLGLSIFCAFKINFRGLLRISCAFVVGTVANLLIIFTITTFFGFNLITVTSTLAVTLFTATFFLIKNGDVFHIQKTKLNTNIRIFIPLAILLALVSIIFYNSIFVSNDAIFAGNRLIWVDWPIHISFISSFVHGNNFPPQNPMHTGGITTYPFLIEFLSAILQTLGASLKMSLVLPGIILVFTLISLLYHFGQTFFEKKAVLVISIFVALIPGGLGFLYFIQDLLKSGNFTQTLIFPPHEYTFYAQKNLWFFTFLYSELLPQRAFLLGLPIFFTSLILFTSAIAKPSRAKLMLSSYLIALLPFIHMHTFISAIIFFPIFIVLQLIDILRNGSTEAAKAFIFNTSVYFFLPILGLGLIQLPFFLGVGAASFAPYFGWMKGDENFVIFWFKNTGLYWPLWVIGFLKIKSRVAKNLLIASLSLFILPNLFRFAPWPYDNLKILTYWYIIGAFAVSTAIVTIWNKKILGKYIAILLFISLIFSGSLEILRILNIDKTQITLWNKDDIEVSKEVIKSTPPRSTILTAPVHDHPVSSLAGRNIIIGFPGNAWSWGYSDWSQREQDVKTMYLGEKDAENLIKKYKVNYVTVGPKERTQFSINLSYFNKYPQINLEKGWVLYDVSNLWSNSFR